MSERTSAHTNPMPAALARTGVHDAVLDYLGGKPRGRVLDVPAGHGALAGRLLDLGFNVSCCDIDPGIFNLDAVQVDWGDLNAAMPYDDEEFDYVCCVEGIEHTENPYNALRELARVLKPGGRLILTTPNYLNIERRVKFFITGAFTKPVSMRDFKEKYHGKVYGMHASPLGYTLLKFALEHAGLRITNLAFDRKKPKQIFLLPLAWLLRLYASLWPKKSREKYLIAETMSDTILMGGNTLIIFAEKPGSSKA